MKLCFALRERLQQGYSARDSLADFFSGVVVALVALPLGMALAIASDVAPQHGLYTVIIAGFVVALLGGSRLQVTGPTAAFVVILVPIVHKFGLGGLLIAGFMAGIILLAMGLAGMGKLIEYIPYPVTTGFTSGIAVVIATIQIKDFLGLPISKMPDSYIERLETLAKHLHEVSSHEFILGCLTLAGLIFFQSNSVAKRTNGWSKKVPSPLIVLSSITLIAIYLENQGFIPSVATIRSRFEIPQSLPSWLSPFSLPGPNGEPIQWSLELVESLMLPAFAIAMLGGIESLLSAVVADGLGKTKHDPDAELVALGIGNIVTPMFGGIPATGAIARTATNFRFGAKSPVSAMVHSGVVLMILLFAAPYVSYLPMSALAALLLMVSWNMFEPKHVIRILRVSPRSDVFVFLTCFLLTVIFDMVIGVTAGILLAAFLFIKRISELTTASLFKSRQPMIMESSETMTYRISGPLFFGAAQKAISTLMTIGSPVPLIILDLTDVPVLDMTGLVALESCVDQLHARGQKLMICSPSEEIRNLLRKSEVMQDKEIKIVSTIEPFKPSQ